MNKTSSREYHIVCTKNNYKGMIHMPCTCTNGCNNCGYEPVIKQVFNCPGSQKVIKHQHIVKYQHDTINEYDIIHEHEYNTRDVVREREVVKQNDYSAYQPNYCPEPCCEPNYYGAGTMYKPMNYLGKRW